MDLNTLKNAHEKHILVVGDVMLDSYIEGDVHRMSPEAPVPILEEKMTYNRLGGAANVALNLSALGFQVTLIGVVGNDDTGNTLSKMLNETSIHNELIVDDNRVTTLKQRYLARGKQLLRLDREDTRYVSENIQSQITSRFSLIKDSIDGVVLSDYDKGVLDSSIIQQIITSCNAQSIPTYADPKHRQFWDYTGVTFFKPNKNELSASHAFENSLEEQVKYVYSKMNCSYLICTLAEKGMAYLTKGIFEIIPTKTIDVVDVSGAGDTAMATIVLCHQFGFSLKEICLVSNTASSQICQKKGVSIISIAELLTEYL